MAKKKFEIGLLEVHENKRWDDFVGGHPQRMLAHCWDFLVALENKSGFQFFPIVFKKGKQLVGVFPVFFQSKNGLKALTSPPPGSGISELGPLLILEGKQQYSDERYLHEFVRLFDVFGKKKFGNIDLINLIIPTGSSDMRVFQWEGYEVSPYYSYRKKLNGTPEELIASFYSQTRTDVRRALKNNEIVIKEGGEEEMLAINNLVAQRYKDQGITYSIGNDFLKEVYSKFYSKFKILSLEKSGVILTGLILVFNGNRLSHWIGGTPPKEKLIGANELLHYNAMQLSKEHGMQFYELVGANTEQLCKFKSKYNPELSMMFNVSKKNLKGELAEKAYNLLRKIKS